MSSKFVLQQEDGTVAGGNARGEGAVDLQMSRGDASQVAGNRYDVITGGQSNKTFDLDGYRFIGGGFQNLINAAGYSVIAGGYQNSIISSGVAWNTISGGRLNTAYNSYTTIGGGYSNTVSQNYSTVSGGQSNTASTGTHATVVGGQGNLASGGYSLAGGINSTASGGNSVAIGYVASASGNRSVAIGGEGCVASSAGAVVIGGELNRAQGLYSVAFGKDTLSYLYSQFAHASGFFDVRGTAQESVLVARKLDTLSSAATTVLSLDGTGTTSLIIPDGSNRAWNVTVKWVAVCTATGSGTTAVGDVAIATDSFMFKKVSGTSSIGSVQNLQNSQDATMAGATCSYAVGGSQSLQITFTAPASANATTFRVVAKVELTEVAW